MPVANANNFVDVGNASFVTVSPLPPQKRTDENQLIERMQALEKRLEKHVATSRGQLKVNSPLPKDFNITFANATAAAAGCKQSDVHILQVQALDSEHSLSVLTFEAPDDVVRLVQDQAADPDSRLAMGPLRPYLIEKSEANAAPAPENIPANAPAPCPPVSESTTVTDQDKEAERTQDQDQQPLVTYGELEPFGNEDTAQELTEHAIKEGDDMVDQLERAEVAEEKRSVFRALTRLRGVAITSFDGVAKSHTQNIAEYAKKHQWRLTHPLRYLAQEEGDVSKWAYPASVDF